MATDGPGSSSLLTPEAPYERLRTTEVLRRVSGQEVTPPHQHSSTLPLSELDFEAFERLAAELVYRGGASSVHFYGRRGQKQFGLDIVAFPRAGAPTVYQVRRLHELTPAQLRGAVQDYARGPGQAEHRRFGAATFILVTSAQTEHDTDITDEFDRLRTKYDGDLALDVWGCEALGRKLRDAPHLVTATLSSVWSIAWCGPTRASEPQDPDGLGLVEDPVEVLGLDHLRREAVTSLTVGDAGGAARSHGALARALHDAGFIGASSAELHKQARVLADAGEADMAGELLTTAAMAAMLAADSYRWTGEKYLLDEYKSRLNGQLQARVDLLDLTDRWYEEGHHLLPQVVEQLRTLRAAGDPHLPDFCCQAIELALIDDLFDYSREVMELGPEINTALSELVELARASSPTNRLVRARIRCAVADSSLTLQQTPEDVHHVYRNLMADASAGRFLNAGGLVLSRAAYAFAIRGDQEHAIQLWNAAVRESTNARHFGDVRAHLRSADWANVEASTDRNQQFPTVNLPNDEHALQIEPRTFVAAVLSLQRHKLINAFAHARKSIWHARISGHLTEERIALRLFADLQAEAGEPVSACMLAVMAGECDEAVQHAQKAKALVGCSQLLATGLRTREAAAARVIGTQAELYEDADVPEVSHRLLERATTLWDDPAQWDPIPAKEAVIALCEFGRRLPPDITSDCLRLAEPFLAGTPSGFGEHLVRLLGNLYLAAPEERPRLDAALTRVVDMSDPPDMIWHVLAHIWTDATLDLTAAVESAALSGSMHAFLLLVGKRCVPFRMQHVVRGGVAALLNRPRTAERPERMNSRASFSTTTADSLLALMKSDPLRQFEPEHFTADRCQLLGYTTWAHGPVAHDDEVSHGQVSEPSAMPPDIALLAAGGLPQLARALCSKVLDIAKDADDLAGNRIDALRATFTLLPFLEPVERADAVVGLMALNSEPCFSNHELTEMETSVLDRFQFHTGIHRLPAHALVCAAEVVRLQTESSADSGFLDRHSGSMSTTWDSIAKDIVVRATRLLRSSQEGMSYLGAQALDRLSQARPDLLSIFSVGMLSHEDERVRAIGVAILPADSHDLLDDLAHDEAVIVRRALARRAPDLSKETLSRLAEDSHFDVRDELGRNNMHAQSESPAN